MYDNQNTTIMTRMRWLGQWAGITWLCVSLPNCTYRFTNEHVVVPRGIQSIAVENIYDTSGEVIPHYILWESLQREFAEDGHLRVVSQGRADAILRAHITKAAVNPVGSSFETTPDKDTNPEKSPPPAPIKFRNLGQAAEFTRREQLNLNVNIEIIELYSRDVIFNKSYSGLRQFRSARSEQAVAEKKSHFLLYEEALRSKFTEISDDIASNVVRDFIIGR